jgi:hypothetical protein
MELHSLQGNVSSNMVLCNEGRVFSRLSEGILGGRDLRGSTLAQEEVLGGF